jgi:hypothetical protein
MSRPPESWEIDVPLVTNRWMLLDWAKVLGWTYLLFCGLMALIFTATGEAAAVLPLFWIMAMVVGGIALLGLLAMVVLFGNRFRMRYSISNEGILAETLDRQARFINRLPVGGSSLLVQSREDQMVPWRAIARTHPYPGNRSIVLLNRWRRVMVVYCQEADFARVSAFIQGQVAVRGDPIRQRRNPLPARLLWSALAVLACLPLFQMPYYFELDLFLPILLLCFTLATLWLVRFLGVVVLGASLYGIVMTLILGFQVHRAALFPSLGAYPAFAWLDSGEWIQLALAWLGLAFLVLLSIQALRNRLPSLLELDESGPD